MTEILTTQTVEEYFNTHKWLELLKAFDEIPLDSIRAIFLKRVNPGQADWFNMTAEQFTQWIETRILELKKKKDLFWWEMLVWYVMRSYGNTPYASASVDFAIKLALVSDNWPKKNDIIKLIFAKIKDIDRVSIYWDVPSMERFLTDLAHRATILSGYTHEDWVNLERAVGYIVKEEDFLWIDRLKNHLERIENGKCYPSSFSFLTPLEIVREEHMSYLRVRIGGLCGQSLRLAAIVCESTFSTRKETAAYQSLRMCAE